MLHQLIQQCVQRTPDVPALCFKQDTLTYSELEKAVQQASSGLRALGTEKDDRVGVYLPKQFEVVTAMFGATAADGVFVPINPILKPEQVGHILRDCATSVLITSPDRARLLRDTLAECPDLTHLIITGSDKLEPAQFPGLSVYSWRQMLGDARWPESRRIGSDMAAILYTSGSTGRPKGVVLSHYNMLAGAESVASYLHNTANDRLLAVLPFSFDYGLSQLTTAFSVGASVVLMDYLLPRDVIRAVARYGITGLAAVPPLWNQLATLPWPSEAVECLRYITNSGGAMPVATTSQLQASLPDTDIYLMYGLTEAFRSTFLEPGLVSVRPDSMGRAIPNADIMVVNPDGSECGPEKPGELVHRGALVSLGYWGDRDETEIRFKPAPGQASGLPNPEIAVWSGDLVRRDSDGYLYFIGRNDEMIKTSGYRVSPGEIEEVVLDMPGIEQTVAFGAPHPQLGSGIVLVVQKSTSSRSLDVDEVLAHCRIHLPMFMLPGHVEITSDLPRNPNGKIDRKSLTKRLANVFTAPEQPA